MSSSNKTSLGLNQWDATDPIQRVDFNKDNEIINEKFGRVNDLLDQMDEQWIIPVLINGAEVNNAVTNVPPRFRKSLNTVFIEGVDWKNGN